MAVLQDPGKPDGRLLVDADGRPLAHFVEVHRDARRVADLLAPCDGVSAAEPIPLVLADLRGWLVAADEGLGWLLVQAGGRLTRHAHVYSRDLRRDPAPVAWAQPPTPAGVTIGPVDRGAADLAAAYAAAYPPEHADWRFEPPPEDLEADLGGVLEGATVGPLLAASRLALDREGKAIGAVLVTDAGGEPPFGGAWVAQLFRAPAPELAGTGRALLESALAAATVAGLPALSLVVSDGNPAEGLYRSLGLQRIHTSLSVQL